MYFYLSGESRHASNLLPESKFNFPKNQHWPERRGTSPAVTQRTEVEEEDDPVFDNSLFTNVTAQLGKVAHLQCTVLNIKQSNPVSERDVSFMLDRLIQYQFSWCALRKKANKKFVPRPDSLARRD